MLLHTLDTPENHRDMPEAQNKHQWLSTDKISGVVLSMVTDRKEWGSKIIELRWKEGVESIEIV